jgi:hypothetical protein
VDVGWGLIAAAALLWPAHALGIVDGIPLDGRVEALLVGVLFPTLWWFYPAFLRGTAVRAAIVALVALKTIDATVVAQQGWCGRFVTSRPLAFGGSAAQHTWDARADWRDAEPRCSTIVARPYLTLDRFPIWFLNMAPQSGRPPEAIVRLSIDGYVAPRAGGTLAIDLHDVQRIRGTIGSQTIDRGPLDRIAVDLPSGPSRVNLEMSLTGERWRFEPLWNNRNLFDEVPTAASDSRPPTRWTSWLSRAFSFAAIGLLAAWCAAAVADLRPPVAMTAWVVAVSAICGMVSAIDLPRHGRLAILLIAAAPFVPVPRRLQSMRGAFALVGVPWLVLYVCGRLGGIGSVTFYTIGDDWLQFQRYAYRIFMQGYWLEGGQQTFWFQPLYRWVAGCVHVVFGDSSIGELYMDAAALLVGALFAFHLTKRECGFRWGVGAAVLTLLTVVVGPTWYLVGRGLSEIVSSGFIYLAAFCVLRARTGRLTFAWLAGLFAVLGFYSRLNNLPFALATIVFAVSLKVRASDAWRPLALWRRARLLPVASVLLALAAALHLLALRTWYYTSVFSVFFGTARDSLSTIRAGDSLGATLQLMADSVLVLVTMQDPPRFDPRGVLVIVGTVASLLALLRVPRLAALPFAPAAWCLAGLAGALFARGTSYVGRFSIHLIPIGVAVALCAAAQLVDAIRPAGAAGRLAPVPPVV